MIVLDTNIISEIVRPAPSGSVISWLNRQRTIDLAVTTVTLGELAYGVEALPDGEKRTALQYSIDRFIDVAFADRVLEFDRPSAVAYGAVMAARRRAGRPMSVPDGQIAAMTMRHEAMLATRNVRDFEGCGVPLVDPFDD